MVTTARNQDIDVGSNQKIVGVTGLSNREGRISEEANTAIRDIRTRFALYREMTNDATIATLLDCIKLPLLASEFTVVAGSEEQSDVELAQFIEANMFGMVKQSWRSHVLDSLEAVEYGFALSEIVMEKRDDGRLYVRNLEPRGQETLEKWEFEDGRATGFIQRDPVAFATLTVPMDKLVHIRFRGRKNNPEGNSLMRALYRTYRFKKEFEVLQAVGVERGIGGTPVFYMPENSAVLTKAQLDDLDEKLAALRSDRTSFLRLPWGSKLTSYPEGGSGLEVRTIIAELKMDIFLRGFSQFLTLGTQETGTQALVQGDIDFFHLSLIAIQQEMLESWNNNLIPYILVSNAIDLNTIKLPQITWSDPGHIDLQQLLQSYKTGVETTLFTPTNADEDHLRNVMDLPPRITGEEEGRRVSPIGALTPPGVPSANAPNPNTPPDQPATE